MRRALLLSSVLALVTLPCASLAATDPTYAALRAARPDGRRVPVSGLVLERDAFRFQLDSGAIHFLAPVDGRTVGAVFVGNGSYRLSPATANERRQLALSSGGGKDFETLTDDFDSLLLLFTDGTAQEIEKHAAVQAGSPEPRATEACERYLKRQKKDFRTNFHLRVLMDLLNSPGAANGAFLALVDGKKYPPALAAVDPDGAEALRVGFRLGGEDTVLLVADPNRGGLWYHAERRVEVDNGEASPEKRLTDALDYKVETSIEKDADLSGTTVVRFRPLLAGVRMLPVHLTPTLRIGEAGSRWRASTTASSRSWRSRTRRASSTSRSIPTPGRPTSSGRSTAR